MRLISSEINILELTKMFFNAVFISLDESLCQMHECKFKYPQDGSLETDIKKFRIIFYFGSVQLQLTMKLRVKLTRKHQNHP